MEPIKMTRAEYETKYGQAPDIQAAPEEQKPLTFGERAKLSFGGEEQISELKRREEEAGLRGKFDIGDIADIAGGALPIIGAAAGGFTPFGLAGSAVGAGLGEAAKQAIGQAFGVRETFDIGDIVKTTAGTYVGGKVLGSLFKFIIEKIPVKLISTIFKESADDIITKVKTGGKNITQAQEILREGLKGSPEQMMTQAYGTIKQLETQVQTKVTGQLVRIANKNGYINLIKDYLKNLKKTSFGFESEIAKDGTNLVNALQKTKGNIIPGEIALPLRRFIDGVRKTSSFRLNPALSPKEQSYKTAANLLRKELAKQIEGIGELMSKYRVHIQAFDDLADYAAKTQNKELFDLIDVFIMYGIDPSAWIARRGLTSAGFKTYAAQGLYKSGQLLEKVLPIGAVPSLVTEGLKGQFKD